MGDSGATISSNGTDARASLVCPNCNNLNLAGFPAGVKFAPSDQELIEHLESLVLVKEGGGSGAHALINHFIPTIEGDIGICYTHPENLPGVTRDGQSKHFFHRTSKAYPTSTRIRRKIQSERGQGSSEDVGEAHWQQTGKACPVIVCGRQKGCKKFLVLQNIKQGKRKRTNWVMHQYHLGMSEEKKDGELVLSKVFYRCPDSTMIEQNDEKAGVSDTVSVDQRQVHGNNHHIKSQHYVHRDLADTSLSVHSAQVAVGDPVSGDDQGQVHDNNHHIPSQHHVQSVDNKEEPDTTLSLALSTGWFR